VAAGERLPLAQEQLELKGHAIEVRLYAEDPEQEFLPQAGELVHLALPPECAHVRVDTGVVSGDRVSVFYDPMIAKLIVWGERREGAVRELDRALSQVQALGIATNLALLARIVRHPAFLAGDVHTGFLAEHQQRLLAPDAGGARELTLVACVGHLLARKACRAGPAGDPWSPWSELSAFRVNEPPMEALRLQLAGRVLEVSVTHEADGFALALQGERHLVRAPRLDGGQLSCMLDGRSLRGVYVERAGRAFVFTAARGATFELAARAGGAPELGEDERVIKAPMPGKISAVLVAEGAKVEKGALLLRLEAMKMEHTLKAPGAGVVRELSVSAGQQVEAGSTLLVLGPVEEVEP
jgi:3-methylcrotonyl-CoA carboxylase alpha subunit